MTSKFFLIITSCLGLTWLIIQAVALASPSVPIRSLSLATIKSGVDGLEIWFGILGSCMRSSYSKPVICTNVKAVKYDLSLITSVDHDRDYAAGAPFDAAKPSAVEIVFIIISLTVSFILWVVLTVRVALGWTKPKKLAALNLWSKIFAAISTSGFIFFMYFAVKFIQAVRTFNLEAKNTEFVAKSGIVFLIVGVGFPLLVVFAVFSTNFEPKPPVAAKLQPVNLKLKRKNSMDSESVKSDLESGNTERD